MVGLTEFVSGLEERVSALSAELESAKAFQADNEGMCSSVLHDF